MDGISKKVTGQDSPKKGLVINEDLNDPLTNNFTTALFDDPDARQIKS